MGWNKVFSLLWSTFGIWFYFCFYLNTAWPPGHNGCLGFHVFEEMEASEACNFHWFKEALCFLWVIVEERKGYWLQNYRPLKKICHSHLLWCYGHKYAIYKAVLFSTDKQGTAPEEDEKINSTLRSVFKIWIQVSLAWRNGDKQTAAVFKVKKKVNLIIAMRLPSNQQEFQEVTSQASWL